MGDKYVVRTILLNGGKEYGPGAEIFGKVRLNWVPEVAQTFEGAPPSWVEGKKIDWARR